MKGVISLLTLATPAEGFASHYKRTQALVRARQAGDDPPSVVDWNEASVEVLSSAAADCAAGPCDVDDLVNIKAAFEGRLDFFDAIVRNYDAHGLVGALDDAAAAEDAAAAAADVSGATAEDRALRNYLTGVKKQGLHVKRKLRDIESLLTDRQ